MKLSEELYLNMTKEYSTKQHKIWNYFLSELTQDQCSSNTAFVMDLVRRFDIELEESLSWIEDEMKQHEGRRKIRAENHWRGKIETGMKEEEQQLMKQMLDLQPNEARDSFEDYSYKMKQVHEQLQARHLNHETL